MAWIKLGEETCSATVTVLTTSVFTPSKNMMALSTSFDTPSSNTLGGFRLGKTSIDTGNNYAYRSRQNFAGSENPQHTQNRIQAGIDGGDQFTISYLYNISNEEKLSISHTASDGGAGNNAPQSMECVGKWVDNDQFDIYQQYSGHSGGGTRHIASGSNLTVLGSDGTPEGVKVQDGAVYYETDTNKEFLLYNDVWTEL